MFRRWRYRRRCLRRARHCKTDSLGSYLRACARVDAGHINDTPLIAVDLELTGLDRNTDHIIAMGWTLIDQGKIRFEGNRHLLITAGRSVGSSAAIHELLDSEVAGGISLEEGLDALFTAAQGRIWVLHHAGLDLGFLRNACRHWAGAAPAFIVLDTMEIELRRRKRRELPVKPGDLQLGRLRQRYGLPRYTAHNALNDALATAELLLAQAATLEPDQPLRLAPHLQYY